MQDQVSSRVCILVRTFLLACRWPSSHCVLKWWDRASQLLVSLYIRIISYWIGILSIWPHLTSITSVKASPPKVVTLQLGLNVWIVQGQNHSNQASCTVLLQHESESEVAQSCPTLCDTMDCSPPGSSLRPGSSIHGIFQARVLEWVAISFSRGSSWPRDQTLVSRIADRGFTVWATREAPHYSVTRIICQKLVLGLCISFLLK